MHDSPTTQLKKSTKKNLRLNISFLLSVLSPFYFDQFVRSTILNVLRCFRSLTTGFLVSILFFSPTIWFKPVPRLSLVPGTSIMIILVLQYPYVRWFCVLVITAIAIPAEEYHVPRTAPWYKYFIYSCFHAHSSVWQMTAGWYSLRQYQVQVLLLF
jgi:cytochrome c oxidase assembly factor CtaG